VHPSATGLAGNGMMANGQDQNHAPQKAKVPQSASSQPTRVSTDELMRGTKELIILHEGMEYRLRITSQNKLILTK